MTQKTRNTYPTHGFSLLELLASISILGVIATLALTTIWKSLDDGHQASCHVNRAEIEIQCERWNRSNGSYPSAALTSIGADLNYFPEGIPTCPVDGTNYTIDNTTGLVVGHDH